MNLSRISSRLVAASLALAVAGALVACGGDDNDGESAEQRAIDDVCESRADLDSSIQEVRDDLASANFGNAKDGLSDVKEDFNELVAAVGRLAGERADEIRPEVDSLKSTIDSLTNAQSLGELGTAIDQLGPKFEAVVKAIDTNIDCSTADVD